MFLCNMKKNKKIVNRMNKHGIRIICEVIFKAKLVEVQSVECDHLAH